MTDQQFFDSRDLFRTYEPDVADGAKRTLVHAALWRARTDLRADASLSPPHPCSSWTALDA